MTLIAVPISVDDAPSAHARAARAAEHGADLVEYRIDTFTDPAAVQALVAGSPLPCLVTARAAWEGGHCDLDETDRISLLEHAGLGADGITPSYLDLELAAYQKSANLRQKIGLVVDHPDQPRPDVSTGLILSTHDFETMPPDLDRRVLAMADAPACRIIKAAWRARSLRDNIDAFELIARRLKPTIALCMGETGLPSRVLAKKFGAHLTFAALDAESTSAPGQPTLDELKHLYRWDAQTPDTRVYGVIGWPVGHSASPAFHNAGFTANRLRRRVPADAHPPGVRALQSHRAALAGLRPAALQRRQRHHPPQAEPAALRGRTGRRPSNRSPPPSAPPTRCTAAPTARSTPATPTTPRSWAPPATSWANDLAGKRVAVLGAGGAARAAVAGFAAEGSHVTVFNRTVTKAEALAAEFGANAAPLDTLDVYAFDLVINCTSLGMHPTWTRRPPRSRQRKRTRTAPSSSTPSTTPPKQSCCVKPKPRAAKRSTVWRCSCDKAPRSTRCGPGTSRRSRCFARCSKRAWRAVESGRSR